MLYRLNQISSSKQAPASDDEYDHMGNIKRKLSKLSPITSRTPVSTSSSSNMSSNGGIRHEIMKRVCLLSPFKLVNHDFVSIAAAGSGSQEKANGGINMKELSPIAVVSPIELE